MPKGRRTGCSCPARESIAAEGLMSSTIRQDSPNKTLPAAALFLANGVQSGHDGRHLKPGQERGRESPARRASALATSSAGFSCPRMAVLIQ